MSGKIERVAVGLLLLVAVTLGTFLRFQLVGVASGFGTFAYLRHAHSHLGYYGVLFPLLWMGWRASGGRSLSPTGFALYALAAAISAVGFAWRGYFVVSIAGSTVVGIGWLVVAWHNRSWLRDPGSWRFSGPPAVVVGALCVPPIAVLTSRDPVLAQELVRTFLGVLVFGVFVPGALDRLGVGAGVPRVAGPLWLLCALVAAVWLGLGVHPLLSAGLCACGTWLAFVIGRARLPLWLRGLWLAFALGTSGLAIGLIPKSIPVTLGGMHFTFLGPLLVTWVRDVARTSSGRELPLWLVLAWLAPVSAMSLAVTLRHGELAAGAGVGIVVMVGVGAAALHAAPSGARAREGGQ